MSECRIGTGFDAHALEDGVRLVLGGVEFAHARGLAPRSGPERFVNDPGTGVVGVVDGVEVAVSALPQRR